jgi:hypothetical protein
LTARAISHSALCAEVFLGTGFGIWAAATVFVPGVAVKLAVVAVPLLSALFFWAILRPSRWMAVFFISLLLLPPLPVALGDSGVHVAPLFALLGVISSFVWVREWRPWFHSLGMALAIFAGILLTSVGWAALYSGVHIAVASLARVLLLAISLFIFIYAFAGPGQNERNDLWLSRLLFGAAIAAALFACVDFSFQLPAPAGYGDQFVWLEEGVFRRAQGLFYEASTLGNFCAFFLLMAVIALFQKREDAFFSRPVLLLGIFALSAALVLSYSRASALNVATGVCVFLCIRFRRVGRLSFVTFVTLVLAGVAIHAALPSFSSYYWERLIGSFRFFGETPDAVLSGRLSHWVTLLHFLSGHPWHLFFGIGYKTLPYSDFIGSTVITDNTYLSLLVETGIVGLAVFAVLNILILRTGFWARRSHRPGAVFLGEWIFCFWCGQMVQMFSGDLITYWRVLPVYFWVLGAAARQTLPE